MRIPNDLTPDAFRNMLKPKALYKNTNEMLGDLSHLTNNLHSALHRGGNQVTSEVLTILIEIGNLTITASQRYIHASKPVK